MFIKVAYEFKNGKTGIVSFFNFGKLLRWRELMGDMLDKALCRVYVSKDLHEVFQLVPSIKYFEKGDLEK